MHRRCCRKKRRGLFQRLGLFGAHTAGCTFEALPSERIRTMPDDRLPKARLKRQEVGERSELLGFHGWLPGSHSTAVWSCPFLRPRAFFRLEVVNGALRCKRTSVRGGEATRPYVELFFFTLGWLNMDGTGLCWVLIINWHIWPCPKGHRIIIPSPAPKQTGQPCSHCCAQCGR